MSPELELGVQALLERRHAQLVESGDRRPGKRLVGEIRERSPAPQIERPAQQIGGRLCIAAFVRLKRIVRPALETVEIEPLRFDAEDVAGRARLDRLRAERLPQLGDLTLYLRHGGDRRRARVEVVGEALHRHHTVRTQQQDRERSTLFRSAEPDRPVVGEDLERSEDPELEHSCGR